MSLARTLRTLVHLRPSQLLHRLWYRARRPWFRLTMGGGGGIAQIPHPLLRPDWPGEAGEGQRIAAGRIRLIGIEGDVHGWTDQGQTLLWRFTLHYFEWLPHTAALGPQGGAVARALVTHWLDRFGGFHPVAWHPYPLSLRLFAWLSFAPFLCDGAEPSFVERFCRALDRQAGHLAKVLERDVGGNHLVKNLKALIAAALALPRHGARLEGALARLKGEIDRQILPDGCHYERSPSYHEQVLCDLAETAALFPAVGRTAPEFLTTAIRRMEPAAAFFRHPDGGLALFNDGSAESVIRTPLPVPPDSLPDAGYHRLAHQDLVLLVDCGPCCPDDLPAHAHADTLSFELSAGRQRVIVNCGTYAYQDPVWRNRLRGTPAHSTLSVDGGDSAEVYGVFRLGRRPRRFTVSADSRRFQGEHDGWAHLGLVHRRRLELGPNGLDGLDEVQRLRPGPPHSLSVRFHLHPDVTVRAEGDSAQLTLPDGSVWRLRAAVPPRLEDGVYAPRFNLMLPSRTLCLDAGLAGDTTALAWSLRRR